MKKLLALTCIALSLAGLASATPYTDVNNANVRLDSISGPWWAPNPLYNPSYTGTFTLAGYNPAVEQIASASVTFDLWDAGYFDHESYKVTIDDLTLSGGSFFWNLSFGSGLFGTALADLNADGILSYTVSATSGSFWLNTATINAESVAIEVPTHNVPDQGLTVAFLGLGLLGLATLKRKLRR
jgi:hypothetical protein